MYVRDSNKRVFYIRTEMCVCEKAVAEQMKTILEAGDWAHASTAYRHYIKCLPEAVAQRIAEQISGSIQANVVGQLDVDIDPEPD